ncbi:MAG: hypothetical protein WD250_11520 [Egibacteraceae bacterium]
MSEQKADMQCEVCGHPVPAEQPALRVGSCEFPFRVHDECRDRMGDIQEFIEDLCRLSDEQPDGLLGLGGWDLAAGADTATAEQGGEARDALATSLDAYLTGSEPDGGRLNVENGALYLDGWWPVLVGLGERVQLVRADDDPEALGLGRVVAGALARHGLRPCTMDERLTESIGLQRLGLLGASWQLWAPDQELADAALADRQPAGELRPTSDDHAAAPQR